MKTKFLVTGLMIFFGFNQTVGAAPAMPVNPASLAAAPLPAHIGVVAGVKGSVQINTPGQVGRIASSGQPVMLDDEISTGPEGNLQILLLDQTVFTIGPNSSMKIDKFVYDPSNDNGEVKAEIIKGVFRFMTGKIGRKNPSNMEVELPTGTIGIRGTIVMGEASAGKSTAVLLGPGEKTNTGSRIGRFILTGEVNGKTQKTEVTRPGYGASINESGSVSRAFLVPVQEITRMTQALEPVHTAPPQPGQTQGTNGQPQNQRQAQQGVQPPQGVQGQNPPPGTEPGNGNQGSATQQAGQERAGARGPLNTAGRLGNFVQGFMHEGDKAAQQNVNTQFNRVPDGATSRNQLQVAGQQIGGIHKFVQNGVPLFNPSGTQIGSYNLQYDINFGARQMGGGNSRVTGNIAGTGLGNFQFNLNNTRAFGFGDQNAVFNYAGVTNALTPGAGNCTGCVANITIEPGNAGGVVAANARHEVVINQATIERARGGGVTPRIEGAS